MPRRFVLMLLTAALAGFSAAALLFYSRGAPTHLLGQPVSISAAWARYDFPEAGFSAIFPAEPQRDHQEPSLNNDDAATPRQYRMHLSKEGSEYRVVATVIPEGMSVDLETIQRQAMKNLNVQVIDRREVSVGGD